jgi:hypothetical protein
MTVISAMLTRKCIAIGSDSYITRLANGKRHLVPKLMGPKIVRFDRIRAAASYWGLAELNGISTYEWLRQIAATCQARPTRPSLSELAELLCEDLRPRLSSHIWRHRGIGIHLAGYERVDGYLVPELFLITNYADPTYQKRSTLDWTRRTTFDVFQTQPVSWKHDADPVERSRFRAYLDNGGVYTVNNGDPVMFNPAANAVFTMLREMIANRSAVYSDSPKAWQTLATLPIRMVSEFQEGTCVPLSRLVGGQIHDVVITKTGEPISSSGVPAS